MIMNKATNHLISDGSPRAGKVETMHANIEERGNGFPDAGDYVKGDDDQLYVVVRTGSRIETQGAGRGNVCIGYELELADWQDLGSDDDVYPCLAILSDN